MSGDPDATLGALDGRAGYHLRRASSAFAADFAATMGPIGLRQVPFGILCVVAANPGINQGAAGRALGIQRANMVLLINQLVDSGLVHRRIASDDRRAFALHLTAAGTQALDDGLARVAVHEERMLAGLDAAERSTLIALLGRIAAGS